ncbi:MAG: CRISPR-associated protein Cas5 [Epsilonproteobacteria bacterium]|nr:CRISPR-associated protein Cas5 [Campylobacterota bacterium]
MKVIRFKIEGLLNSFRVPFFRSYQKSFLAPPKTTVIGMLCNISLKSQKDFFEILNNSEIDISIIIDNIKGRAKDLWSYKTIDKKNRGKSVIRRDRLFIPTYTIYLSIKEDKLYQEILDSLKSPQNIPSMGLDDEIIRVYEVREIELDKNQNRIDSIFLDKGISYKGFIKDTSKPIEMPTANITPTKFIAFKKDKLIPREVKEEFAQIEFINCEIEFQEDIKTFVDRELNNRLVFY